MIFAYSQDRRRLHERGMDVAVDLWSEISKQYGKLWSLGIAMVERAPLNVHDLGRR